MNPIDQDIPVFCLHLEDVTDNPASFLIREIPTTSDMHVPDHLLFSLRELSSKFQQSIMCLVGVNDSITVSSAWELTPVSMHYSQGNGVHTPLSRLVLYPRSVSICVG